MRELTAGVLAAFASVACYDPELAPGAAADAAPIVPEPDPGPDAAGLSRSCPTGYLAESGSCYRGVTDPVTWVEAEADCEDDPTADVPPHLVVIEDGEENELVRTAESADRWLGIVQTTSGWTWVSGETVVWSNWPSGATLDKTCGEMKGDGRWDDDDCDGDTRVYLCEYDGWPPALAP